MTSIATDETQTAPVQAAGATGRVARVTGPVVDIEFPHDSIPGIYNALKTTITIGEDVARDHARGRTAPRDDLVARSR
jgi:F0F1-type ATP synthase, beta subunit